MLTLFLRGIIIYILVFAVIRLMGKRQVSDLQPFDLVITLLIADVASNPVSDTDIPILYGIIPILTLFLVHWLLSVISLKSAKARAFICGHSIILIQKGVLQEQALRAANYSVSELMEQLRTKDIFELSDVEYAILETNGALSVFLKGPKQTPDYEALNLQSPAVSLPYMLILDRKINENAMKNLGVTKEWLYTQIKKLGYNSEREVLFASLNAQGVLHTQDLMKHGGRVHFINIEVK